jgi:hypothetical protein
MLQFPAVDVASQGDAAKVGPESRAAAAAVIINARLFKANLSLISGPTAVEDVLMPPASDRIDTPLASAGGGTLANFIRPRLAGFAPFRPGFLFLIRR